MDSLTGIKYTWTSNKAKRIHLCRGDDKPLCKSNGGFDIISDERPMHKKVCGVCRKEVGMSKQEAKADPKAFETDIMMMRSKNINRVKSQKFLKSYEWRAARYKALKKNNGCCELCGRNKHDGIQLNVDHIKPRSKYPKLALKQSNLQVLCGDCNHGKSNTDETDWREPSLAKLMSEAL